MEWVVNNQLINCVNAGTWAMIGCQIILDLGFVVDRLPISSVSKAAAVLDSRERHPWSGSRPYFLDSHASDSDD